MACIIWYALLGNMVCIIWKYGVHYLGNMVCIIWMVLFPLQKPNLILNVDGVIATSFVDLLRHSGAFTRYVSQGS